MSPNEKLYLALVLFAFISFYCLREFISLTPTRPSDHGAIAAAFYLFIPLQYWLVGIKWLTMLTIAIPVYAFLLLPVDAHVVPEDVVRHLLLGAGLQLEPDAVLELFQEALRRPAVLHEQVFEARLRAVLAQAGCCHQGGQAVPFAGWGGHDRSAVGTPGGLVGMGGEQPFADRAGPVLLGDGDALGCPVVTDPP